jgi:hypothetical protein
MVGALDGPDAVEFSTGPRALPVRSEPFPPRGARPAAPSTMPRGGRGAQPTNGRRRVARPYSVPLVRCAGGRVTLVHERGPPPYPPPPQFGGYGAPATELAGMVDGSCRGAILYTFRVCVVGVARGVGCREVPYTARLGSVGGLRREGERYRESHGSQGACIPGGSRARALSGV